MPGGSRGARAVPRGDRGVAAEPVPLSRARGGRARGRSSRPPSCTRRRPRSSIRPSPRLVLIGGDPRSAGGLAKAAEAYAAAAALEPTEATAAKTIEIREKAAFAAMPDGIRVDRDRRRPSPARSSRRCSACGSSDLLRRARAPTPVVMTDTRGNWAAPWILSVTRAGLMEPYPNHTFQPNALVRRGDLAQAVSRALALDRRRRTRGSPPRGATPRPRFSDVAPGPSELSARPRVAVAVGRDDAARATAVLPAGAAGHRRRSAGAP